MAYDFKSLNEVPTQDAPTENTTVMAFESGNPIQIPAVEFGGKGLVVDLRGYTINPPGGGQNVISDISYDPIYEAFMAGKNVVFQTAPEVGSSMFLQCIGAILVDGSGCMCAFGPGAETTMILFTSGSYHSGTTASE